MVVWFRCNLVLLVYILECSSHLICANYLMKTVTRCQNVVNILSFAGVRERVLLKKLKRSNMFVLKSVTETDSPDARSLLKAEARNRTWG